MPGAETNRKKTLLAAVYLLLPLVMLALDLLLFSAPSVPEISYSDFIGRIDRDRVASVVITPQKIYGLDKASGAAEAGPGSPEPTPRKTPWHVDLGSLRHAFDRYEAKLGRLEAQQQAVRARRFVVTRLQDRELLARLEAHHVDARARIESHWLGNLVSNWIVPFAILSLLWVFFSRRLMRGPGSLQVGGSKARIYEADPERRVHFSDVAGIDEAVEETREIVAFLREPGRFTRFGARLPKGVLLVGPPGTGKTLLARAVAGEAGVPFFSLSGSDFVEMFVGVGAARVRDLFAEAQRKAPCIVFIDELDAIGKRRAGAGPMPGGYDERENTLNQLLVEMDGFDPRTGVVLMAATNRPEVLDPALLRPGRFDRQILVDRPDREGRLALFELYARPLLLADDVDLAAMAAQTPGFVGADIANLCNEAALRASRRAHPRIRMDDFQEALERVIGGLERKSRVLSEQERRIVAFHESGHALVGHFTPGADPVRKISIVPRGRAALGYTLQAPLADRYLLTRGELLGRIRTLMGGRAAEAAVFGEISTGAADDLEKASRIARDMLVVYGMSETLPNVSLVDRSVPDFLGQEAPRPRHSEEVEHALDAEVLKILDACYRAAAALIDKERSRLDALAARLLEREKLEQPELLAILGSPPTPEVDRSQPAVRGP